MHTDNQTYTKVDSEKLEEKIREINQSEKKAKLGKQQNKSLQELEKE